MWASVLACYVAVHAFTLPHACCVISDDIDVCNKTNSNSNFINKVWILFLKTNLTSLVQLSDFVELINASATSAHQPRGGNNEQMTDRHPPHHPPHHQLLAPLVGDCMTSANMQINEIDWSRRCKAKLSNQSICYSMLLINVCMTIIHLYCSRLPAIQTCNGNIHKITEIRKK